MRRQLRLVSAALLGGIFLALALVITPAASPAQHTLPISHSAALPAGYASSARAALVADQMPRFYAVHHGDTLWSVAAQFYGSGRLWPALWWVNRHAIPNPAALESGVTLRLSAWHPPAAWLGRLAVAAIPVPAPITAGVPAPSAAAAVPPLTPAAASSPVGAGAPGSFQACVITAESGGDPGAVNASSGAGGLYGFLPSTWQALGHSGLPENASVAEQNQAFAQEYAAGGTSAWSPYDGC